jgi:pimeloyl-ACP methyl ester carboxylesterase
MEFATTKNGVRLCYEVTGKGVPVVFLHEFAGDLQSWEPQIRELSRLYRCIAFNARGYPPSDIPESPDSYSQDIAGDDVIAVLDHLDVDTAHVVGLSMGSGTALNIAIRHRDRLRSLVLCGCGYGSFPDQREAWLAANRSLESQLERDPQTAFLEYAGGSTRVQYRNKNPLGWEEFLRRLQAHSPIGAILTLRRVQALRPSVLELESALGELALPALVIVGDEDEPALEASRYLKRCFRYGDLMVMPDTGHTVNLEEPRMFNDALRGFLEAVENNRRDLSVQEPPA